MQNRIWRLVGYFLICLLAFGIGYGVSYTRGMRDGLNYATEIGFYILKNQNVTLELNAEEISRLIFSYQNQISPCFI